MGWGGVDRGGSALNSKRFDAVPLYDYCPGNAAAIYAYFYVVWGRRVAEGDSRASGRFLASHLLLAFSAVSPRNRLQLYAYL